MTFTAEQADQAAKIIAEGGKRVVVARSLGVSLREAAKLIDEIQEGKHSVSINLKQSKSQDRIQQLIDQNMSPYEVALETGNTFTTIRNNILKLDANHSPVEQEMRKLAVDGISFKKLQAEYMFQTVEQAQEAVEQAFPGSYCSVINREDGPWLLPITDNSSQFEKYAEKREQRRFEYYVSANREYMHIKMDDHLPGKELRVFNFTDVHFGSKYHRTAVFDRCLELVKNDPMSFLFDGGDTTESITKASVANPMEQFLTNNEQINYAAHKYGDVVDKIFFKIWGNHCGGRFEKTAELDASEIIAQFLRVPYFRHRVVIDIEWRGHVWTIYATHTWNKAHTQEAVVREVKKVMSDNTFKIHFFCSGHNHNAFIQPVDVNKKIDGRCIETMRYHIVNGGSFLAKTGSYATEYSNTPQDLTLLRLRDDGTYLPASIPILSL